MRTIVPVREATPRLATLVADSADAPLGVSTQQSACELVERRYLSPQSPSTHERTSASVAVGAHQHHRLAAGERPQLLKLRRRPCPQPRRQSESAAGCVHRCRRAAWPVVASSRSGVSTRVCASMPFQHLDHLRNHADSIVILNFLMACSTTKGPAHQLGMTGKAPTCVRFRDLCGWTHSTIGNTSCTNLIMNG